MRPVKSFFSLIEVIIVLVILALVMSIAVADFSDRSPGEIRIEVEDSLATVFANAAIRAQAFGNVVTMAIKVNDEGGFTCSLRSQVSTAELSTVPEDETAEEAYAREESAHAVYIWSGEDTYTISEDAKLLDYETMLDEQEELLFYFYPDGEATGPLLKFAILEQEYTFSVDRLNGQLVVQEIEN